MSPCSGAAKSLPRFDPGVMESFLDEWNLRDLKVRTVPLAAAAGYGYGCIPAMAYAAWWWRHVQLALLPPTDAAVAWRGV